ncbi:MAG TPA: polysaccharide deacetylase family protein [Geodermatophilus sp.]|nr:polysaccharide deacetylase family protein [Geodermatophilus sp.]
MTTTVPVLMYHSVAVDPDRATHRLSVHPRMFEAQLDFLGERGFTPMTFSGLGAALRDGSALPERPVVLTFDDGYADFHREALPLLAARGWPATVFVTTGWLADAEDRAGHPLDEMLTWGQVAEVASAGIEIGAHSHSHPQLDQLPAAALAAELRDSRAYLEDRLGRRVSTLAYPFGYSSPRVRRDVAAAGYDFAAAVRNTRVRPSSTDLRAVPRLTVRRATTLEVFARILMRDDTTSVFLPDRTLTAGYAAVRRTRYVVAKVRGRG